MNDGLVDELVELSPPCHRCTLSVIWAVLNVRCRLLEEGSTNCKRFCLKVKVSPDSDTAEKVDTRGNGLNVNGLILSGLESNKREGGRRVQR